MKNFIAKAESMIRDNVLKRTPSIGRDTYVIYTVWSCKTAGNCKALLSTTLPDGMYYEVTYIGDEKKIILDCYHRIDKVADTFDLTFDGSEAEQRDRQEGRECQ